MKTTDSMSSKDFQALSRKKEPVAIQRMKEWLREAGIEFVEEYRFDKVRRFRFDLAIPARKLAIEYEGLNSAKSRHTTLKGYTGDATKYNLATVLGWRVLRYTALNFSEFKTDLVNIA